MRDFHEFLFRLGNLHDCTVTLLEWNSHQKSIIFEIADLHFNFEGLPEYRGPLKGKIAFEGVQQLIVDVDIADGALRINDFTIEASETVGSGTALITFWPRGKI
jgi:hypothetical protein